MSIVWWAAGSISLLYFTGYVIWVGANNSLRFLAAAWHPSRCARLCASMDEKQEPELVSACCTYLLRRTALCVGILSCNTWCCHKRRSKKADRNADYLIVLGAHVYGERMSSNLKYRIELAKEYLEENPETKVIVSGGQGHGEKISEAEAMYRYLIKNGIAKNGYKRKKLL